MSSGYISFIKQNAPFLATGALLSFLSSFGQTYFISIFGGEIRAHYGLSNGDWGLIYMIGTGASAAVMVFAGGLADRFRVRQLGITIILMLGLSCLLMAWNPIAALLPLLVFCLRFFGQGMTTHVATVAMARWFIATRGRALAVAAMGYMFAEATLINQRGYSTNTGPARTPCDTRYSGPWRPQLWHILALEPRSGFIKSTLQKLKAGHTWPLLLFFRWGHSRYSYQRLFMAGPLIALARCPCCHST